MVNFSFQIKLYSNNLSLKSANDENESLDLDISDKHLKVGSSEILRFVTLTCRNFLSLQFLQFSILKSPIQTKL